MRSAPPPSAGRAGAGFTVLELMIAMAVFTILGGTAVFMMRQAANSFSTGAREGDLLDRHDSLLPDLARDLARLAIPDAFDPPVLPTIEPAPGAPPPPPLPPVELRLRSGAITLRDQGAAEIKAVPCIFLSFVIHTGDEANDPRLRTAGDAPLAADTARPFVRAEVEKAGPNTVFQPTGGLMEVCWIAVPRDPANPALLTLYRGYRAPVGGTGSLLDPASFDSLAEIDARFEERHRGVLHFGVTWRRAGLGSWEEGTDRGSGDDTPYVGPVWDSTRALDKTWPLHRRADSLGDPSDDLFPQFVRLEATLAPPALGGYRRGQTTLVEAIAPDSNRLLVENLDALLGPGPQQRFLKIDTEWLAFDATRIDPVARALLLVERGARSSVRAMHDVGAQIWVGQPASEVVSLPVWRDRTYRRSDGRRGVR